MGSVKARVVGAVLAMFLLATLGWAGETAIAIKIQVTPELAALFQQKGVAARAQATKFSQPTLVVRWQGDHPAVQRYNAQGKELASQDKALLNSHGEAFTVASF